LTRLVLLSGLSLFSKKPTQDPWDSTVAGFTTAGACFGQIHTVLTIHKSRLSDKVERQNNVDNILAKIPGASNLVHFGTTPTAKNQDAATAQLMQLTHYGLNTPFTERLKNFRVDWEKLKPTLKPSCDLDMPFSDAAKLGKELVNKVDKLLQRIDFLLQIQTAKNTTAFPLPTSSSNPLASHPASNSASPDITHATTTQPRYRHTF